MRHVIILAAAAIAAACGKSNPRADSAGSVAPVVGSRDVSGDVRTALAVDSGVRASPAKTDSILKAHALTPAGLDSLMYRIASDSALRAQYAAARR